MNTRGILTMLPSEYFDRNCFIGASNIVRVEMARRYEIGVGNLCWGNDFPHPEGPRRASTSLGRTSSVMSSSTRRGGPPSRSKDLWTPRSSQIGVSGTAWPHLLSE